MKLITTIPKKGGLSSQLVEHISKQFSETIHFPGNVRKLLSKTPGISRARIENIADASLKRYAIKNKITVIPTTLPKTTENAKKAYSIEMMSELSDFIRNALKEYRQYGMDPNPYFDRMKQQMKTITNSEKIIVTSEYSRNTFENAGYENIYTIGMGVDTERFSIKEKNNDEIKFIMVACFTPMKGIKYLVDAWKEYNFNLELMGNIPSQISKKIPKGINIKKFGNPLEFYQNADCLIMPTLSEGLSKVILEAMACGLSVITTENSGAGDFLTKRNGIMIPTRDSKSILSAVQYMIDNKEDVKKMGKNARNTALKNTWHHFSKRLNRIISEDA